MTRSQLPSLSWCFSCRPSFLVTLLNFKFWITSNLSQPILHLMNLFYKPLCNSSCGSSTVTNAEGKELRLARSLRSGCHWVGYFGGLWGRMSSMLGSQLVVFWHSLEFLACRSITQISALISTWHSPWGHVCVLTSPFYLFIYFFLISLFIRMAAVD